MLSVQKTKLIQIVEEHASQLFRKIDANQEIVDNTPRTS